MRRAVAPTRESSRIATWGLQLALALTAGCGQSRQAIDDDRFSESVFADPPRAYAPQTRWWWPGGAVEDATLVEQLRQFADLGYGAVEIQPFMAGVARTDLEQDSRVRTVGDSTFLDRLHTAACEAQRLGLAWDLTLGSGWSTGGPNIGDDGERQVVVGELTLAGPADYDGPLPSVEPPAWIGDTNALLYSIDGFDDELVLVAVIGAEVIDDIANPPVLGATVDLTTAVSGNTLVWQVPDGDHRVFAVYENLTRHFPAGGAYPGELEDARVIDHLDRKGVEAFLAADFTRWVEAVNDCPPRAVFVDSFELVADLPWTKAFATKFRDALGYEIHSLLPFLFRQGGESEYTKLFGGLGPARYRAADNRGKRAREDYEDFRASLFAEEFITPLRQWSEAREIDLRLQAHGGYADVLDAYAMADVPESEGLYGGGSYDFLRLAASAAHVAGKPYATIETFPSVGRLELTEDESWVLIGRAFSAGINRIIHHGNAYPYLHQSGERWYPFEVIPDNAFSLGPFDISFDIHPGSDIASVLSKLNRVVARLSYALTRGSPAVEVAWLKPEGEAENFIGGGIEPGANESETSIALRRAGYAYDRVSRAALTASVAESARLHVGEATYRALLIEGLETADPELLQAVERATVAGVPVIWIGDFPARAPGLVDAEARDAMVESLVEALTPAVRVSGTATVIPDELLDAGVKPSLSPVDAGGLDVSVERRRVVDGDLYFIFNESYEPTTNRLRIEDPFDDAILFDPETGDPVETNTPDGVLTISLPAARGNVLWVRR